MTNDVTVIGNTITIIYNDEMIIRSIKDILYCKTFGRNSHIYFEYEKPITAPIGIKSLSEMLPIECFDLCHVKYIIHFNIIRHSIIKGDTIYYEKLTFPIARGRYDKFIDGVIAYFNAGN